MEEVRNLIDKEKQDVYCTNCGAHFYIYEPKCPYCGTTNELGDEAKFLEHLESIIDNMEDVENIPKEAMEKEAKKTWRKAGKVFLILAVLVVIALAIVLLATKTTNKVSNDKTREQVLWQYENYPILDKLYEEKDYDGIIEFENELYSNPETEEFSIYNWEHIEFIASYRDYYNLVNYKDFLEEDGKADTVSKEILFSSAVELLYEPHEIKVRNGRLSKQEYENILIYQDSARQFLMDHFGMTASEVDDLASRVCADYPRVGVAYEKEREVVKEYEFID